MRSLIIAAALALMASPTAAASFDCAKARTKVEKRICANPALSKADEAAAAAYAAALAGSPSPLNLKRQQREWLAYEREEATDLGAAIAERGKSLWAMTLADRRARRPVAVASLGRRCVPLITTPACAVVRSGKVAGGGGLLWQVIEDKTEGEAASIVLQADAAGQATPVVWTQTIGVAYYDDPKVVASPAGSLLVLGGMLDGTGAFNAEAVFAMSGRGRWYQIDTASWLDKLPGSLPAGLAVWKGVYPDYEKLTASTALWKTSDANCCPTGGLVELTFSLPGDTLQIASAKVTLGEDAARGE